MLIIFTICMIYLVSIAEPLFLVNSVNKKKLLMSPPYGPYIYIGTLRGNYKLRDKLFNMNNLPRNSAKNFEALTTLVNLGHLGVTSIDETPKLIF